MYLIILNICGETLKFLWNVKIRYKYLHLKSSKNFIIEVSETQILHENLILFPTTHTDTNIWLLVLNLRKWRTSLEQ